jgi:[ribosomal protein S18]-alanine N-acetyltransferase
MTGTRPTTWQLRRATPDDLDAIMQIEDAVFTPDAWSRDSMRHELGLRDGYYLVAFPVGRPEQIDAYAGLFAPLRAPSADVQTIAVAEHARRGGLGRVLMTQMIAEARSRGAEEVFLEVRADNESAQNLYRSLGFEQIAVRKGYYKGGVDAIVMRLALQGAKVALA